MICPRAKNAPRSAAAASARVPATTAGDIPSTGRPDGLSRPTCAARLWARCIWRTLKVPADSSNARGAASKSLVISSRKNTAASRVSSSTSIQQRRPSLKNPPPKRSIAETCARLVEGVSLTDGSTRFSSYLTCCVSGFTGYSYP